MTYTVFIYTLDQPTIDQSLFSTWLSSVLDCHSITDISHIWIYFIPTFSVSHHSVLFTLISQLYVHLSTYATTYQRLDWNLTVYLHQFSLPLPELLSSTSIHHDQLYIYSWDSFRLLSPSLPSSSISSSRIPLNDISHFYTHLLSKLTLFTYTSPKYHYVAVGGTFDHLHPGHKLLLSCTAMNTSDIMYIGLVHDSLLLNKRYSQFIQSYSIRESIVRSFVHSFAPHLSIQIVPLTDPFGPAASLESLDALFATVETASNSNQVNNERARQGLKPIAIELIPVISSSSFNENDMHNKLSSTSIRAWYHNHTE